MPELRKLGPAYGPLASRRVCLYAQRVANSIASVVIVIAIVWPIATRMPVFPIGM